MRYRIKWVRACWTFVQLGTTVFRSPSEHLRRFAIVSTFELEEATPLLVVVHRHVQVSRGDAHVRVPDGVANLGERAAAGQGVANKRVPAVVDGQGANDQMPVTQIRLYPLVNGKPLDPRLDESETDGSLKTKPLQKTGSISWTVPGKLAANPNYAIKVVAFGDRDDQRAELLTSSFVVKAWIKPTLSLSVEPATVRPGQRLAIKWKTQGEVDGVALTLQGPAGNVDLSPYGGTEDGALTVPKLKNSGRAGQFNWLVPPNLPAEREYKISISAEHCAEQDVKPFMVAAAQETSGDKSAAAESEKAPATGDKENHQPEAPANEK